MSRSKFSYVYAQTNFSIEELRRCLLVSDQLRFLVPGPFHFPSAEAEKELQTWVDQGRVVIPSIAEHAHWRSLAENKEEEYTEWSIYFAKHICLAFKEEKAEFELHEGGHRIAHAWDDGSGLYPPMFVASRFMRGQPVKDLATHFGRIEESLAQNNGFGAPDLAVQFADSAAPGYASQWLFLKCALGEISKGASSDLRLGLVPRSEIEVKWLKGLLEEDLLFDVTSPASLYSVLQVASCRTQHDLSLSSIPLERFVDLCSHQADARSDFSEKVLRWTSELSQKSDAAARREYLTKLRNSEVIPAVDEFNIALRKSLRSTLISSNASDLITLAVSGIAAAVCVASGYPDIAGAAGAAALPSGIKVGDKLVSQMVSGREQSSKTWAAFASSLSKI